MTRLTAIEYAIPSGTIGHSIPRSSQRRVFQNRAWLSWRVGALSPFFGALDADYLTATVMSANGTCTVGQFEVVTARAWFRGRTSPTQMAPPLSLARFCILSLW